MYNPIRGILRQTQKYDKLNILTLDTHERYQSWLAQTGHNFYSIKSTKLKQWVTEYAPIPKNYFQIEESHFFSKFIYQIDFDLVLCQSKFGQYENLAPIAESLHLPLICLEHTVPPPGALQDKVNKYTSMTGDINVYISKHSLDAWNAKSGINKVIYHGIDNKFWKPFIDLEKRQPKVLTVVNDFINRDRECGFNLWNQATADIPRSVYGNTPGLSRAAYSVNELLTIYNNHQIYINTSITSTIPTVLLEAAACGCSIVTTGSCAIPEIFKHNENCLIGSTAKELRQHILHLMNEPEEMSRLGNAARLTVLERLGMDKFINSWQETLREATKIPFIGAT